MLHRRNVLAGAAFASLASLAPLAPFAFGRPARAADKPSEIRIDWATYNPVSMVLKEKGLLEKEFAKDGIGIRWVQSLGSNKALEFLNAGSIDFGSTAGSAALLSKINSNPIKSIYVYSQPEWTALVTRKDTSINKVLLQHPDGKTALIRGDVDAWAGLDPMMAQAQVEDGARLFYRNKDANTYGILNGREEFLKTYPELTRRVLAIYENARKYCLANYDDEKRAFIEATKLPGAVVDIQLKERTDLTFNRIGAPQRDTILKAGLALQQAGVIPGNVDVKKSLDDLIDDRFVGAA